MRLRNLVLATGLFSTLSCGDYVTSPLIDRFSTQEYHCADSDCKKVGASIQRNALERPLNFIGHIYKTGINDHYYGWSWTDTVFARDSVFTIRQIRWSEMNRQEGGSYSSFKLSGLENKEVTIVMGAGADSIVERVRPTGK